MWQYGLRLVAEPAPALLFRKNTVTDRSHERKHAVVAHPRAGLVGLFQSDDVVRIIRILPPIAVRSGLGSPMVHTPGPGDTRVDIARREGKLAL